VFKIFPNQSYYNYKQISLLTSFSKIFEKVIYKRLHQLIINNNILAPEQYGFRNSSSTETASYNLINNILSARDKKSSVGGIFCDLTKAFDCVDHEILFSKLEFYGIMGKANFLIRTYLHSRYQRVIINNKHSNKYFSKWEMVKIGVPQGSNLGPLFFLLSINDPPFIVNDVSKPTLSADTSIISTNPNFTDFRRETDTLFTSLNIWFETNLLSLNYNKTHYIYFVSKTTSYLNSCINHGNNYITSTQNTKFLGFVTDNTISWKTHIDFLLPKLSSAC
jgi:hypothetical protein